MQSQILLAFNETQWKKKFKIFHCALPAMTLGLNFHITLTHVKSCKKDIRKLLCRGLMQPLVVQVNCSKKN